MRLLRLEADIVSVQCFEPVQAFRGTRPGAGCNCATGALRMAMVSLPIVVGFSIASAGCETTDGGT